MKMYYTAKDLATKTGLSLKTVYNYINKHNITTKKEGGKTLFNFEMFLKVTGAEEIQENIITNDPKETVQNVQDLQDLQKLQKLQNEYNLIVTEKEQLEKQKTNLTEQVNFYALSLKEEKGQNKRLQDKNEKLEQEKETIQIKYFTLKIKGTRIIVILISLLILSILLILGLVFNLIKF